MPTHSPSSKSAPTIPTIPANPQPPTPIPQPPTPNPTTPNPTTPTLPSGAVIGVLNAFFSSSATIFIYIYDGCLGGAFTDDGECESGFVGQQVTQYMAYSGMGVGAVVLAALPFVDTLGSPLPPNREGRMERKLVVGNVICALVIVYMAVTIIVSQSAQEIKVRRRGVSQRVSEPVSQ